jgi:hypothetical protein
MSVANLTDLTTPNSENNLFNPSAVVREDKFWTIIFVMEFFLWFGTISSMLRLRGFLLGFFRCFPLFRSQRRFLLNFLIRFAFSGHSVRSLSTHIRSIVQLNDERLLCRQPTICRYIVKWRLSGGFLPLRPEFLTYRIGCLLLHVKQIATNFYCAD